MLNSNCNIFDGGIKKYSISKSDFFEGWPTMAKLKDDGLICIFTRCNGHNERDNTTLMCTVSRDKGVSWSEPKPFTDTVNKDYYYNNARIQRLGDELVVVCDMVKANERQEKPADVFLWISSDEGVTWSKPIITAANGIVPDIKQLRSGNWLLTAHRTDSKTNRLVQYCYISEDRGASWSEEITVAQDLRYNLCEASVLECDDGTLVAYMRENSWQGYDCLKTISKDGGYTWSKVYNTPIPGCHRPTVGYLKDGRVFLTYRFLQGGRCKGITAENTFMAVMGGDTPQITDRNAQSTSIISLDFDRSQYPDSGYTDWIQFDDETVYIVNYIIDDWDKCQIRGYSVDLKRIFL